MDERRLDRGQAESSRSFDRFIAIESGPLYIIDIAVRVRPFPPPLPPLLPFHARRTGIRRPVNPGNAIVDEKEREREEREIRGVS